MTASAGHTCMVDYDAGIGEYETYAWSCIELPPGCHGVASCDCISGPGMCGVSEDKRTVSFGCF